LCKNIGRKWVIGYSKINESFGLTITKGIAAGIPIIVSNIDWPSEIVHDLPAGFTFEVNNVDSLVKAISIVMGLYDKNKIQ
jgi:glycosyltransferase involved in cell wall biosynthesis